LLIGPCIGLGMNRKSHGMALVIPTPPGCFIPLLLLHRSGVLLVVSLEIHVQDAND